MCFWRCLQNLQDTLLGDLDFLEFLHLAPRPEGSVADGQPLPQKEIIQREHCDVLAMKVE